MRIPWSALTVMIAVSILPAMVGASGAQAQDTLKVLHPFTWAGFPSGTLARDEAGNLYGTAGTGGLCIPFCGAVWKLAPNSNGAWTTAILHAFVNLDGSYPVGGVILDASGNLYGTTVYGGANSSGACAATFGSGGGCGLVFKLTPNADGRWTESVLHNFNFLDGSHPYGSLIFDGSGNLYGTTTDGGSSTACQGASCGVVFKLAPNQDGTWTESVIHTFAHADGAHPYDKLIFDAAGNLYGTTAYGGNSSAGVVFKLAPNSDETWTESVLYSFKGGNDGRVPSADVIFDATGDLYGTTVYGGSSEVPCRCDGFGTVFKLAPNPNGTWSESVIHSFAGKDGAAPETALTFDGTGNLYGTTFSGDIGFENIEASGWGVVFKLTPTVGGWSESVVHAFEGYGNGPDSALVFDKAGNLYGTTLVGTSGGLVFELTP